MPKLTAPEASKLLRELSNRMELEGGNPYRARAYSRAAENLSLSPLPLDQLIAEGRLKDIPGLKPDRIRVRNYSGAGQEGPDAAAVKIHSKMKLRPAHAFRGPHSQSCGRAPFT